MTQRRDAVFAHRFENEPIDGFDVEEEKKKAAEESTRQDRLTMVIINLSEHSSDED